MSAKYIVTITLTLGLTGAALAADYTTPEYSGPSARIESGGLGNAGQSNFTRSAPVSNPYHNDTGYERQIGVRHDRIMREMDLREEKREAEELRHLKLNE